MTLQIDENNLKEGVLGLVIAIVEILEEALRIQSVKRMESGQLSEEEIERLGKSLMDLDDAIRQIKLDQGLAETVGQIRAELDDIVDEVVNTMVNPEDSKDPGLLDTTNARCIIGEREEETC
ncbi:MAG: gas vesicle protein GvpK [Methanoregulaceae archaeon]